MKAKVRVNMMRDAVALSKDQERMRRRHGAAIKANPVPSYDLAEHVEREQHFTPAQVAAQWNLSVHTVPRLFADVPGVLKIGTKGKHVSLRIPARLLRAYHTKLSACRRAEVRAKARGAKANVKVHITRNIQ